MWHIFNSIVVTIKHLNLDYLTNMQVLGRLELKFDPIDLAYEF
jgi:hypothetical protein